MSHSCTISYLAHVWKLNYLRYTDEIVQPFAIIMKFKQRKVAILGVGGYAAHMKNWHKEFSFFCSVGHQMAAEDFSWEGFVNLINF